MSYIILENLPVTDVIELMKNKRKLKIWTVKLAEELLEDLSLAARARKIGMTDAAYRYWLNILKKEDSL